MTLSRNQKIACQFDKAVNYDSASSIQKEAAERLAHLVGRHLTLKAPATILEIGCGTGHLSEQLLRLYPEASFILSDIAPQMLERTESKIRQTGLYSPKIQFHLMDGEIFDPPPPSRQVTLIVSNLCIQWFRDRPSAFKYFAEFLLPGGMLCLTTLANGTFHEWKESCKVASVSCGIPDYPTLSTLNSDWPKHGKGEWYLQTIKEDMPSAHVFLRNLKAIGASLPHATHRPLKISALQKAMTVFDKAYHDITYQIAFGLFRKDLKCTK
ncbi:methyltransferase domain-containing protein [Acetobacteraceae bacterium ESL0709]|nr:methyltransferase domain-containing protein [Acetobacteraceae bacterium ESL0697]MDF7677213.1 methyltransferase domain-containing protein [Acetobacteraceae bacterium ESL0709]